jgi:predicted metal-binding protein
MREAESTFKDGVILVCTNQRPDGSPKPSCGRVRGEGLRAWLKEQGKRDAELRGVRVVSSSCLGICPSDGVVVSATPANRSVVVDPVADRDAVLQFARECFGGGRSAFDRLRGKLRR